MATAEVGALRVTLGIDSGAFSDGLSKAQKQLKAMGTQMQQVGSTMAAVGAGMTATISTAVVAAGFHLLKGSQDAAHAAGQVESALKSMGAASGRTLPQLQQTAEALRNLTGIDDDEILTKVTANLLSFGNVAGDVFDRAQTSILNISARMKTDLQGATMMVGKALNDPIKGLAALRRVGIQFTAQQEDQIKAMAEVGNMAGAQAVMLGELERQFGGAAEAAGRADIWMPLKTMLMDLEGAFEPIIRNAVGPLIEKVADLGRTFAALSPQVQAFIAAGAVVAAALGPALVVIGAVVTALGSLATAFAAGGVLAGLAGFAAAAIPFVAAGAAIAAAIYLFRDDLAPIFAEFRAAAEAALGPALQSIMAAAKDAFAALGPAVSAVVDVVGPLLAALGKLLLEAFGPIVLRALQVLAAGIGNAFSIIGAALRVITALLRGDWSGAWNAAGSLVMTIVRGIGNVIEAVFPGIGRVVGRMVDEVKNWLGRKLGEVLDGVISKVRSVSDAFFRMYDAVVGHSYVPDMVEGVAEWMAKLDAGMVVPATRATDATKAVFGKLRDDVAGIMESLLTDTEAAARNLALQTATIERAVGAGILTRRQGDQALAGLAGQGIALPRPVTLNPLGTDNQDIAQSLRDGVQKAQDAFDEAARRFGDQFAYNMERALRGDIKGAFLDMLADSIRASLSSFGTSLAKGEGGGFGRVASAIGGFFGKLPGFKTGGSFRVGGSGGIDSSLVAFRATPGEMVDVRRPGQGLSGGGGTYFDLRGAVTTQDLLNQMNAISAQAESRSNSWAVKNVPAVTQSKMAKQQQHAIGRRKR